MTTGMVCAADAQAARVGTAVLRAGGNAVDAAVATSAGLAVTAQHLCGMGGDLWAVVAVPGREPVALAAAGRAGSGADPDRLRAEGHTAMPARDDVRSVTVPGCVDGWLALHGAHGRLDLASVLAPAVALAEDGFAVTPGLARSVPVVAHLDGAADFLAAATGPQGLPEVGDTIRRPGVARALRDLVAGGRAGWYGGEFGAELHGIGSAPGPGAAGPGGAGRRAPEFMAADLAEAATAWSAAPCVEAWGHRIWTVPPPSQGYLTLAGAAIADGLGLPGDPADPLWAHLLIESARQAAFDREEVLHDGADPTRLLAPDLLDRRRAAIDPRRSADLGGSHRDGDTTALSVIDGDGVGVSVVQSNAAGFGSHLVVPGLRIFLHNRGIGFSLLPGHANEYRPGRRPAHTLCPTVVTDPNGSLRMVAGTMGGDGQPQYLLQILARILVSGADPDQAVAAGRWGLAAPEDPSSGFDTWRSHGRVRVLVEGQAPAGWAPGLTSLGHRVVRTGPQDSAFGHAQVIVRDAAGRLRGGTDPRTGSGSVAEA